MSAEGRRDLSRTIWVFTVGGVFVVVVVQLMSAAVFLGEPGSAPIYLGILYLISVAALMYSRMVFDLRAASDV